MEHGHLSDRIRQKAVDKWVRPAITQGREKFSISVKEIMAELEQEGFPPHHQAQFCSALRTKTFLNEHGLKIEQTEGPPSKVSTTVVFHYRVESRSKPQPSNAHESPAERAHRVTAGLRGLLKKEIAEFGGTEAFMKWVRSDEDDSE